MQEVYDVAVIGAGVTGLATGMYAGRLALKTIVFGSNSETELAVGGVITLTDVVENYPGFKHLTGMELAEKLRDHALDYDIALKEERALEITKGKNGFQIKTEEGTYDSKTIVIATGSKWRKLPMNGGKEYENKGVSYCSLCDGPLFKGKDVAVIGGSDSAAKESLFLAKHAKKVFIIFRGGKMRPEPVNEKLVSQTKNIFLVPNTNVVEIKGEKFVKSIVLDKPFEGKKELSVEGVFGAIGHVPLNDLAKSLGVELNERGEIKINRNSETNVPGVFAAGDVVDSEFKQAITGVAEGVNAAYSAFKYVSKNSLV
ncbi:MAG: NAD(P)/FAD-dependent oxidoreductase [Candidatus Micrarchaeota archaeon]